MTRRDRALSQDPQNLTWKNDSSRFGFKMLEKMGWSQGKGLGRNQQGSTDYIRPVVNQGSLGLGVETLDEESSWKKSIQDLDGILGGLKSWKPNQDEEEEEQEEEEIVSKKTVKSKSKKTKEEKSSSDDEVASGEEKPESSEEETPSRVPRHHLFSRRQRNKNVSNYSKTDLAAILGVAPPKDDAKDVQIRDEISVKTSSMSSKDYFSKKIKIVEQEDNGPYRKMSKSVTIVKRQVEPEEEEPVVKKQKKTIVQEEEDVQVEVKLKPKKKKSQVEEEEEVPVTKKKVVTPVKKSKIQVEEQDEVEEEVEKPIRKRSTEAKKKVKKISDEEEEVPPPKKTRVVKKVQVEIQVEEEEEEEAPVKTKSKRELGKMTKTVSKKSKRDQ